MHPIVIAIIIATVPLSLSAQRCDEDPYNASSRAHCAASGPGFLKRNCHRFALWIAAGALGAVVGNSQYLYHQLSALVKGGDYIGGTITLKMDEVEDLLSEPERKIMHSAKSNPKPAIELFTQKLSTRKLNSNEEGATDANAGVRFVSRNHDATEFFVDGKAAFGECRHKAIILEAISKRLGVPAELETGETHDGLLHAWVYFPQTHQIADPESGIISDATSYRQAFIKSYQKGFPQGFNRDSF